MLKLTTKTLLMPKNLTNTPDTAYPAISDAPLTMLLRNIFP